MMERVESAAVIAVAVVVPLYENVGCMHKTQNVITIRLSKKDRMK